MMIEISGLWINKSKDGKVRYMAGYMGKARILVFKNTYKEEDKHPDYVMYIDEQAKPPASDKDDMMDTEEDVLF